MTNSKRLSMNRFLALLIVFVVAFASVVSIAGMGKTKNIKDSLSYGLDINGGSFVVLQADLSKTKNSDKKEVMQQTKEVLEKRVDAMGVSNSVVTIEGENRLRVEMPGVKDSNEAIDRIGQTAKLRFTTADDKEYLTGNDVKTSQSTLDDKNGGYKITIDFKSSGQEKFAKATKKAASGQVTPTIKLNQDSEEKSEGPVSDKYKQQQQQTQTQTTTADGQTQSADQSEELVDSKAIVIWLDDEIVTAPTVENMIDNNSCEITQPDGMKKDYAESISALIRGGSLPVELREITSSSQAATIGEGALDTSIIAGAIGLALIFIIMIVFFGFAGVIADFALLTYILLLLWGMAKLNVVLTLPGIAGIILGLGMAVDANVIIFTRIKDMFQEGKSFQYAVAEGTRQATTTVMDSQITTLIASVILYYLGSTTVKGFAVTLMISIVLSLFTAIFLTNFFIKVISSYDIASPKMFGRIIKMKRVFDVISKKRIYYAISCGIVVLGLCFAMFKGFNLGLDFTGGTRIDIDTGHKVSENVIHKSLKSFNLDEEITYSGKDNKIVVIKTTEPLNAKERAEVQNKVCKDLKLDAKKAAVSSEQFEATIGKEIRNNTILSVILASIGMLLYIVFRFRRMRYGLAAVSGVIHDSIILLMFYAIFGFIVNSPLIAALLTVVGYSINDTIVLFDRVRNTIKNKGENALTSDNVNKAITECLSRTLVTSLTTAVAILPLIIMGNESLRDFTIPLFIGVLVGTYSSIFICSPLLVTATPKFIMRRRESKRKTSITGKEKLSVTAQRANSGTGAEHKKTKTGSNPYKDGTIVNPKHQKAKNTRKKANRVT